MSEIVKVENVTKYFKQEKVLDDVNMNLETGHIYGIVGKNGAGKTVLFKIIAGFIKPSSGKVTVAGKIIGVDRDFPDSLGLIIETPGFLSQYNAYQNLLYLANINNKISKEDVKESIRMVGLDPGSNKKVGKFSLGMRQRLGIAYVEAHVGIVRIFKLRQREVFQLAFLLYLAVLCDVPCKAVIVYINVFVALYNVYAVAVERQFKWRINLLYLIIFRRCLSVGRHDALHAECSEVGRVAEVAAVGKAGLAVRVSDRDAVVHVLPDKPALIQRLFVGVLGVVGDAAVGVAHGVAVLAHDKGLFRVLCQKLFDVCHRGIHLAFHIRGGGVFPVPENALVVHKAAGVGAAEVFAHLPQGLAAVALVAARPDEDGRVVFVPFQHGFGAGKHIFPPLRAGTGQRPLV